MYAVLSQMNKAATGRKKKPAQTHGTVFIKNSHIMFLSSPAHCAFPNKANTLEFIIPLYPMCTNDLLSFMHLANEQVQKGIE